jgi:hypothetical protein
LPNNTLVITQPWVGLNRYELRENPIHFAGNGQAHSRDWSGIQWQAQGNQICLLRSGGTNCYSAFSDPTGQAFVRDERTGLLARVTQIEPGDSRNVRAEYQRRLEDQRRRTEMTMLFAGLLFEAMLSGGGGGGGRSRPGQPDWYFETRTGSSSSTGGGMSAPPISSFYGSCHNPMGC